MPKLKSDEETREAFSDAELQLIFKEADDFTRPLFAVAITTALREGDICTLKWTDIDFRERVIRRVMNKTGNTVEIPLVEQTFLFFSQQQVIPVRHCGVICGRIGRTANRNLDRRRRFSRGSRTEKAPVRFPHSSRHENSDEEKKR